YSVLAFKFAVPVKSPVPSPSGSDQMIVTTSSVPVSSSSILTLVMNSCSPTSSSSDGSSQETNIMDGTRIAAKDSFAKRDIELFVILSLVSIVVGFSYLFDQKVYETRNTIFIPGSSTKYLNRLK